MSTRHAVRALLAAVALSVTTATPAMAAGDDTLSPGGSLAIFLGVPLAVFVVVAFLVYLPHMAGGARYRPGVGWWAAPTWFNGPGGGASTEVGRDIAATLAKVELDGEDGGTSARW